MVISARTLGRLTSHCVDGAAMVAELGNAPHTEAPPPAARRTLAASRDDGNRPVASATGTVANSQGGATKARRGGDAVLRKGLSVLCCACFSTDVDRRLT